MTGNRFLSPYTISLVCLVIALAGFGQVKGYGQTPEKGIVGQVVGDEDTKFYVRDVKTADESGSKLVDVSIVFQNNGSGQEQLSPSLVRLVDSQTREYDPQYSSQFPYLYLPSHDILSWNAEFKIVGTNNVSKIYFTPYLSDSRFTIDLTKSMNPPANPPVSTWTLSPNKGVKMSNRQQEITINDEKYVGNTYIIDLTIKNIGNQPINYAASDFKVKDADGFAYSYNIFYDLLSPLLSGTLPPGETVRGDIAFDVKKSSGDMMVILSSISGTPFLHTGTSPIQNVPQPRGHSVEIVLGSSNPDNGEFFVPESITVTKGTTVTWSNNDATLHTVTSGTTEAGNAGTDFDSVYMASGKTFEHTFSNAGTFNYYCTLHPFMKGQIIVK